MEKMKKILKWYHNNIGITLIPRKVHANGVHYRDNYWVLAGRHPYKSITWLWAVYYDGNKKWSKRVYLRRQKPMWM